MAVTPLASDGFDASLFDVDDALLADDRRPEGADEPAASTDRLSLRVLLPAESDATVSASASPLLRRTTTLIGFLGGGRKVTQKGNLTLADARMLLPLLQVDQSLLPLDVDPLANVRSSADVPAINTVVEVSRRAKFIRFDKGQLAPTKRGRLVGRDPLDDLLVLHRALLSIGPATLLAPSGRSSLPDAASLLDKVTDTLLARLLSRSGTWSELDELVDFSLAALDESIEREPYGWSDSFWRVVVTSELRAIIDLLRTAGTVDWREPSSVQLTPIGRWCGIEAARAAGVDVDAIDERVIDGSFEDLVTSSESTDDEGFLADAEAWRRGRTDDAAATELVDAIRRTGDPVLCRWAMATLSLLDRTVSEAPVRSLLDDAATKSWALVWLVDNGVEPASILLDPDPEVLVEVLSLRMSADGATCDSVLAHAGDVDAQVALTASLWRVLSPSTLTVLEHIGRTHADKRVAKAARKAVVQHRSLLANS